MTDTFAGCGPRGDTERIEARNMAQAVREIREDMKRALEILADLRGEWEAGGVTLTPELTNRLAAFLSLDSYVQRGAPPTDGGEILSPEEQDCLVAATGDMPLDGTDAMQLEYALQITERERDDAFQRIADLEAELSRVRDLGSQLVVWRKSVVKAHRDKDSIKMDLLIWEAEKPKEADDAS